MCEICSKQEHEVGLFVGYINTNMVDKGMKEKLHYW